MAREAILRDTKPLVSRRHKCATATAIPKGTYLKYSTDPDVVLASSGVGDMFAGFAHADVNNSTDSGFNTETSVTADRGGVYELTASLAIVLGQLVKTAGINCVMAATDADVTNSFGLVLGRCVETASAGEVVNVEVFAW